MSVGRKETKVMVDKRIVEGEGGGRLDSRP